MGSFRLGCLTAAAIALLSWAAPASASSTFKPRIAGAMGIFPLHGHSDLASGTSIPVVYHGGSVMRDVTVHTVFWAPSGYRFDGPPSLLTLGYEPMLQRFFTNVAHDSGAQSNVFSVLPEYADAGGPGQYAIHYNPATDSIDDTNPYPSSGQCSSPAGIATCVTDAQVQTELDRVIQANDPSGRGLHDLWVVFLPPDVDTCILPGECGTTAYAGYHAISNRGHGATVYALVPDPQIEFVPGPGTDPEGNPEAESSIDVSSHETVESITNPEGDAWMDPNGFEVGDKCENPENGTPLGYAMNGSPYNQVIDGRQYLMQMMWSNPAKGCVQRSTATNSPLPLATVNLTQYSPRVSGNIGSASSGIPVLVAMARGSSVVALAEGSTRANGSWGPVTLRSQTGAPHGVGDDRELLLVRYGPGGPAPDLIATGDGGNPFTESGWTGWYDLDSGFAVHAHSVALSPCGQTGLLTVRVDGAPTAPPIEQCGTESDIATVATPALTPASSITMSSLDNRAPTIHNPNGALIKLTVRLGEPSSVGTLANDQILLNATGFPTCTADLRAQAVRCQGLRPGARYSLGARSARADGNGTARFARFARPLRGGRILALRNSSGRVLTSLHVAHLRVDIKGTQTVLSGGSCQPGDFYGPPLTHPPVSSAIGLGVSGRGTVCPRSGHAKGLSALEISQIDDLSGGQTRTQVPLVERTTPLDGEVLYGGFSAIARSGLPGPHGSTFATGTPVALTIEPAGSTRAIFHAANVDTARGVPVQSLSRGAYVAIWVLRDANGDTRTTRTEFVEG